MPGEAFKVVITDYDYPDISVETAILAGVGAQVVGAQCKSEDELIEVAHDAHALLVQYARVGERTIAKMDRCLAIARYGIGVDIVDVEAATRAGIVVTNVPDYCVNEVADHAVAMYLCLARGLRPYDAAVRRGSWHWSDSGTPLHRLQGAVAGVIGFGKIGRAIAARLKPFGFSVAVFDPYVPAEAIAAQGCHKVDFETLLTSADAVFVQTPLTAETRHMFNRESIARLKPGAIFVDTARGPLVDNAALHEALTSGRLMGAALDDLEEEPAKKRNWQPTNPLLGLANVLVSPHSAYYSEESLVEARETAASEVASVLSGLRPRYVVNRQVLDAPNLRARLTDPLQ
jgi:D-3-phosphoglycerate dehydrogenase